MSVVVVGGGMAGSRVVAELRARDPLRQIVVLESETAPPYNRILLSDLLAGKVAEDDLLLAEPPGVVDRRPGVPAVAIDRSARVVEAADGSRIRYDAVVLAPGSRPLVPPIAGVDRPDGTLVDGVSVFRTLEDCRQILAASAGGRVVVLGGGLLGVEAARGLAHRGIEVELLHARPHLMERQIDAAASELLVRTLSGLGVRVRLRAVTTQVVGTDRVEGVRLEDGTDIAADALVIACGVRPETGLAERAGLEVSSGVVVDDLMRTSDPAIYAVGDCAEHRGTVYGLVVPAWEQARVVAEALAGGTATPYTGSRLVTRLKAAGVDLASLGDPHLEEAGAEVLTFADPARDTYSKLVIRNQHLVGAIMIGDNPTVGTLTQLFDRGTPVPADPRSLLFDSRGGSDAAVPITAAPAGTAVCRCTGVTAGTIVRAWLAGARTAEGVATATRAGTGCGSCRETIADFVTHLSAENTEEVEVPA